MKSHKYLMNELQHPALKLCLEKHVHWKTLEAKGNIKKHSRVLLVIYSSLEVNLSNVMFLSTSASCICISIFSTLVLLYQYQTQHMVTADPLSLSRSSCRFLCCWVLFDKGQVHLMVLINCNKSCPNQGKTWDAFSSGSVSGLFLHYLSFLIFWYSYSPTLVVPTLFMASSQCCLFQHQNPKTGTKSYQ